jgi:hypothetical protein
VWEQKKVGRRWVYLNHLGERIDTCEGFLGIRKIGKDDRQEGLRD